MTAQISLWSYRLFPVSESSSLTKWEPSICEVGTSWRGIALADAHGSYDGSLRQNVAIQLVMTARSLSVKQLPFIEEFLLDGMEGAIEDARVRVVAKGKRNVASSG